jgi:hypothetical protein
MYKHFYVHEITVLDPSALVEVEADGPVFLVTFAAYAKYCFGGPLEAVRGQGGENHVTLRPTGTGSWYLAALEPQFGRYRFILANGSTDWVDFFLKAGGFG